MLLLREDPECPDLRGHSFAPEAQKVMGKCMVMQTSYAYVCVVQYPRISVRYCLRLILFFSKAFELCRTSGRKGTMTLKSTSKHHLRRSKTWPNLSCHCLLTGSQLVRGVHPNHPMSTLSHHPQPLFSTSAAQSGAAEVGLETVRS